MLLLSKWMKYKNYKFPNYKSLVFGGFGEKGNAGRVTKVYNYVAKENCT